MFREKIALCVVSLISVALFLSLGTSVPVRAKGAALAFQNEILGIGFFDLPDDTAVVQDQYLSTAYGVTVVDAKRSLLTRVEWLHETSPTEMNQVVWKFTESFPGIQIHRSRTFVAGYEAVLLWPVPGQVETATAFVLANGRLYRIFYNTEDEMGLKVFRSLTFFPPKGDLTALGLRRAEDALYDSPPWHWQIDPRKPSSEPSKASRSELPGPQPQAYTPPGCVDFPTSKFLQTQWAWNANGTGTGYPQGWSKAGPSYFGENLHVGCDRPTKLNDHFALDHPLKEWDIVYPPAAGTVLYAGWAGGGWSGLGRVVIVDLGDGYWAMAAHLRGVNVTAGQSVGISTVIGWAGGSGNGQDNYLPIHLHQGLYKDANLATWAGGIYGGHSAQPVKVHYFGNGGGDYWYIDRYQWMSW